MGNLNLESDFIRFDSYFDDENRITYVRKDAIDILTHDEDLNFTMIYTKNGNHTAVRETPDEIIRRLNDEVS